MTVRKRPDANPGGRPSVYTPELAQEICNKVATSTDGLRKICRLNPQFPTSETILQWRHKFDDFSSQYDRAKKCQADFLAEDILDIADDEALETTENIQQARLKIDARKWLACKLLPKVYGDKVQNEVTVINHEEALKELK